MVNKNKKLKEGLFGTEISKIISDVGSETRKFSKLSEFVDYTLEEMMPKLFGENIEDAYKNSKKQIDYFMRHLI